jgi:hypothetical protein
MYTTIQRHVWTRLPQRTYTTTKLVLQKSWPSTTQTILKSVSFESFSIFVKAFHTRPRRKRAWVDEIFWRRECNAALIYCGRCVGNIHSQSMQYIIPMHIVYTICEIFPRSRLYIIYNNCITLRLIIMWIDWLDLMQMLFCLIFSFFTSFLNFFTAIIL